MLDIVSPNQLTLDIVKQYLRIDHNLDDMELSLYLKSALSYVYGYVGATFTEDYTKTETKIPVELSIPTLALISHYYENKQVTVKTTDRIDEMINSVLTMNRGSVL